MKARQVTQLKSLWWPMVVEVICVPLEFSVFKYLCYLRKLFEHPRAFNLAFIWPKTDNYNIFSLDDELFQRRLAIQHRSKSWNKLRMGSIWIMSSDRGVYDLLLKNFVSPLSDAIVNWFQNYFLWVVQWVFCELVLNCNTRVRSLEAKMFDSFLACFYVNKKN